MKQLARYGVILAFTVAGVLIVAGCGGDKGTSSNGISSQDQFDEMTQYISFDPNSDSSVVSLMLSDLMTQFWDGVDESDFGAVSELPSALLPGLSKRVAITDTSLSIHYDPVGGWWYVDYLETGSSDFLQLTTSVTIRDSIRFETASGTPQVIPDQTTHRVLQKAVATIGIGLGETGNSAEIDLLATSNSDVGGLNESVAVVNADGGYTLGVTSVSDEGTFNMTLALQSTFDNAAISIPSKVAASVADEAGLDYCPVGGDVSGTFSLDLDVQDNTGHHTANGDWTVGIHFTGGGNTTVEVQSGDFVRTYEGNVCSK